MLEEYRYELEEELAEVKRRWRSSARIERTNASLPARPEGL